MLEGAGVVLGPVPALVQTAELLVLLHEFGPALAAYLATVPDPPVRDLAGIVAYNRDHDTIALKYGQAILEEALAVDHAGDAASYAALRARDAAIAGEHGIDAVLDAYDVAAILVPGAEGCGVGARAGHPSVTVPAGIRPHGRRPFGVTFMGGAWSEARLLSIAYRFEQLTQARVPVSQANPWLVLAAELDD